MRYASLCNVAAEEGTIAVTVRIGIGEVQGDMGGAVGTDLWLFNGPAVVASKIHGPLERSGTN